MTSCISKSLHHIISNAPYAVAVLDKELQYVTVSHQWVTDFKVKDDLTGASHLHLFPLTGELWMVRFTEALQGKNSKGEGEVVSFDGRLHYLRWEVQSWVDDAGEIGGLILYMDNLTAKKAAETAIKRQLDLYQETNEVARIGVWEIDFLKKELYWSPVTRHIYGIGADDEVKMTAAIDFFKEGPARDKMIKHFIMAVESGVGYDQQLELTTARGEDLWVRTKATPVMLDGVCVRMYGTFQDIQQQKVQEMELANSEIKYRSLIENSLSAFLLIIPGGVVIEANQAAIDLFGYTPEEFSQITRSDLLDHTHPNFDNFMRTRHTAGKVNAELTGIRKNGEHFPCQISATIYTDSKGVIINNLVITDMTERLLAEEQVRLSEEQFRGAFEYSAIGMALFSVSGKCKKANQSLCNMLGYTEQEITQLTVEDLTHPEDMHLSHTLIKELTSGERNSYYLEKRYIHRNGKDVWVLLGVSLLRDAENKPVHFISQMQDITEHKISESLILEERRLLRTLIDNLPISVYIKDREFKRTMVNRSEIKYMDGLREEDLLGKTDFELFPAEYAEIWLKEDQQVVETGVSMISKETVDKKPNGAVNYMLTSKIPLFNAAGEIIGLLGINYDITPIKEAEYALAVSEEKYREIFENIQDIYYRTDVNGIVTEISPSVEKYSSYSREHIIGNPVTDFYFYKEDREKIVAALTLGRAVTDFEVKLKSSNSELVNASVNARLIIKDGVVVGSEGSIRDISQRKRQEEELTSLNTELKDLNKHREKLISVIGHDLRNPIAASLKLAELALMDMEDTSKEELTEYLLKMKSGLSNAFGLLEDLLHWAANQFNSHNFNPILISDLQMQVFTCMERLKAMAFEKGLELIEDIAGDVSIYADKDMLDAIVRNLVSNAIKFTRKGSITVAAKYNKKEVLFSVRDTGNGISKEVIGKLFKKSSLYTTYGTSGEKGTGLGLELCLDFVEKHGGRIWVESKEGEGSTFYFTIPVKH